MLLIKLLCSPTKISQSSDDRGSTNTWCTDETCWHGLRKPWGKPHGKKVNTNNYSACQNDARVFHVEIVDSFGGLGAQNKLLIVACIVSCTCSPSFRPSFSPSCRHSSTLWLSRLEEVLFWDQLRNTGDPWPQDNSKAWFWTRTHRVGTLSIKHVRHNRPAFTASEQTGYAHLSHFTQL